DLGGDSLSALTLSTLLTEIFGGQVPVGVILSPANSVGGLSAYIEARRSTGAQRPAIACVHGTNPTVVMAGELTWDKFIDAQTLSAARSLPRFTGVHA